MTSAIIKDGMTLDGTVAASPGRYPTVKFRYRPALPEDVFSYMETPTPTGKARLDATLTLLTKQLVSWDVVDDAGGMVPITDAILRRTHHVVLTTMLNAITGYGPAEQQESEKN
jgi:hypothetical protein